MNPARDHYLAERVNTATPAELTALLFDASVAALRKALRLQTAGRWLDATPAVIRAQQIVLELRHSLDFAASADVRQLSTRLFHLYTWVHERTVAATMNRDPQGTQDALDVLIPLQEAWREMMAGRLPAVA
jgi:flagellar protein FliS